MTSRRNFSLSSVALKCVVKLFFVALIMLSFTFDINYTLSKTLLLSCHVILE